MAKILEQKVLINSPDFSIRHKDQTWLVCERSFRYIHCKYSQTSIAFAVVFRGSNKNRSKHRSARCPMSNVE